MLVIIVLSLVLIMVLSFVHLIQNINFMEEMELLLDVVMLRFNMIVVILVVLQYMLQ